MWRLFSHAEEAKTRDGIPLSDAGLFKSQDHVKTMHLLLILEIDLALNKPLVKKMHVSAFGCFYYIGWTQIDL